MQKERGESCALFPFELNSRHHRADFSAIWNRRRKAMQRLRTGNRAGGGNR